MAKHKQGAQRDKPEFVPDAAGPRRLFHYTTIDAFASIVESGCLYATHVHFLNDATEYQHGLEVAEKLVDARLDQRLTIKKRRLLLEVRKRLHRLGVGTYVASFTPLADDLSQWRAYCRGGGVSIGFPRRQLQSHGVNRGFIVERCDYSTDQHRRQMAAWLDSFVRRRLRGMGADDNPKWTDADEAMWLLPFHAAFVKHAAFQAEREWRAVVEPSCLVDADRFVPDWRARGRRLVEYVKLTLPGAEKPDRLASRPSEVRAADFWKRVRITLSPEIASETQAIAIERMVRRRYDVACTVNLSEVPLRDVT